MLYFLPKFNLPTTSYFFATDIATIERERKFIKATFVSEWNMWKMQMLYLNSFEI